MTLSSLSLSIFQFDVVVIGAGGAGLMTAIELANHNIKVAIISKVPALYSHTSAAQGGINASFGNVTTDDWRWHMYDTIKGSDWLADQDAVEILCKNANKAVLKLAGLGVNFDKDKNGKILQKTYGGQTTNYGKGNLAYRACSVADRTGHAILTTLYQQALNLNIKFFEYNFAIELLIDENQAKGLLCYDLARGQLNQFTSPNVIIATGGYGQIYTTTTAANICTGDGNGLAFKSEIALKDMEFIQFHPTAMHKVGVLISETARAIGGKLINNSGYQFMADYAPQLKDLACRDIVARSIATEINKGNGCGKDKDYVLLDLTNLTGEDFKLRLPNVVELCQTFLNLHPNDSPIPIAPAAHYTMGGIPTNKYGEVLNYKDNTEKVIEGLYSIGETACHSVHGANRLGCNSLLDLIVFAQIVSNRILEKPLKNFPTIKARGNFTLPNGPSDYKIQEIHRSLRSIMQKNVGVFRSKESLLLASSELMNLKEKFKFVGLSSNNKKWNEELTLYFELENMLICAEATISSALAREESRGAHYRNDFPYRDDQNFWQHSLFLPGTDGINQIHYKKVNITPENVGFFPLEARKY